MSFNKDTNIIKSILGLNIKSTESLNFGVRDYLEGRFEGWMKRKGYDIKDSKFHDWFMKGYWGYEVVPNEDKYIEAYNYGKKLSSGKNIRFSEAFIKTPIDQINEGDIIIFGDKEYKVTLLSKSDSPDSFILKAESLDGNDKLDIELKYDTNIPVKNKINIIGNTTEFASGRKNLSAAKAINDRLNDLNKFYMNVTVSTALPMGRGASDKIQNIKAEKEALQKCKNILIGAGFWINN